LAKANNTKTIVITALKGGANYQLILNLITLPFGPIRLFKIRSRIDKIKGALKAPFTRKESV
jgi:hypothetical protein